MGGLFGSQQCADDKVGASDDNAGNTPSKDTQFGQPTNQIQPPPGYSYPPSQPAFPIAPQFYHHAPFNMTPSPQPSTDATQGYPSYGPSWQAYDFPRGHYGGPEMFPPEQFTAHGPLSPGAPRGPPAPPQYNPVIRPTSSSSTSPGKLAGAPGGPPLAWRRNHFCQQRDRGGRMLQGLQICPHYQRFSMTNTMQIMRVMIHQTWAGPRANPQSAWSEQNSPWSNCPKGWGNVTSVPSASGRKYGWLGFTRRSISPWSGDRTVWNNYKIDPCTGRRRSEIFWRLSRPGCVWKISITLNGFGDSGLRCFWRNVPVRFGRLGRREGKAMSNWRRIWESAGVTYRDVISHRCQIWISSLWFIECRTATMNRHPARNSRLRTQIRGTWRSWLISSKMIVARKHHTASLQYTNPTRHRKNWRKSIWDYTHPGTWWMTLYMVRFHTTVPFQMPSSWNWDTMWTYFW